MRLAFAAVAIAAACLQGADAIMPYTPITGLVAAVYTPFDEQLALDTSVVVKQAAYLNATGVHHVLVAGTTGESVKLTVAERKQLAEAWAAVAPTYGINLFIHVGANAMADAQELARHAASIKAAGLVAMSSTYFRPSSVDALVSQLADIFGAAPLLPAWYYHIPSMTGDNYFRGFDMHALLVADITDGETSLPTLRPRIPNLVGIKFTDYDLYTFKRCIDFNGGEFNLLYGRDEQRLGAAAMGAEGAGGSTYNFAGVWGNAVFAEFKSGNINKAREYQRSIVNLVAIYGKAEYAGTDPGKEIMNQLGVPVGPPRGPAKPMTADLITQLRADMKAVGLIPVA